MENKDLLMSIQPIWVEKICNKIKTIEVRKTKCNFNDKCRIFVYCTKSKPALYKKDINKIDFGTDAKRPDLSLNGKIVGHCTCKEIIEFKWNDLNNCYDIDDDALKASCLTQEQLYEYGKGKTLYGYVLSYFMLYAGPTELCQAYKTIDNIKQPITIAPQSWCYVDGVGIT
jgi:predicted transcriptional regulator